MAAPQQMQRLLPACTGEHTGSPLPIQNKFTVKKEQK
jgi:hypothetical protein